MNKEIEQARAFFYAFFSKLFTFTYDKNRFLNVKEMANLIYQNPFNSPSKEAIKNFLDNFDEKKLSAEYDDIFYNLSNDPIPTTASYYIEEIESGKMRLKMVNIVLSSKFRKREDYKDMEDDIGFIFPFMNHLILETLKGDEKSKEFEEKTFSILNMFIDDFIENVYMHTAANLYKNIAIVLKSFIETERLYFEKPKPKIEKISKNVCETNIADKEAAIRKANKKKESENLACDLEEGGDVEDEV